MDVLVGQWSTSEGWTWSNRDAAIPSTADLFLVFGDRAILTEQGGGPLRDILRHSPNAVAVGCSTAGEILGESVREGSLAVAAIRFHASRVRLVTAPITRTTSREAGQRIAESLASPDLAHVFVLSDGLDVNGSELVAGLREGLPSGVQATGGLSADGARFERTGVWVNGSFHSNLAVGVGFYGQALRIGYGSVGGWDAFGPDRLVTRSSGNVLYELDGRSALALYKLYLGEYAEGLPASGLLFPLLVRKDEHDPGFVRTIIAVDEKAESLIFAGDVPQGALARLMKANFDRLIDGASGAGALAHEALGRRAAQLAVLISCVGRKLILRQRTEEEVQAVRERLEVPLPIVGFYSNGEISPSRAGVPTDFHNQTMTVTTLAEDA
ncbi:MAG: FIST C-terminal domain-containing protein [Kiritimatiellae bacterium]|nr:FIST C-terminal domain-containing protein [Kiritimatiellia bacterium]MDW8457532.1 FIST N-terminal domain-containing protein [Verrucomicrobiota bacterium]